MSSLTYVWGLDHEGVEGWVAQGYPNFNANGIEFGQFGHDSIEHFPRGQKHGIIADELMALGARLHIRVESGWWAKQKFGLAPQETFAGELVTLMQVMSDDRLTLPDAVEAPVVNAEALDLEPMLAEIIAAAAVQGDDEVFWNEGEEVLADGRLMQNMLAWLRRGIRAARARYKGRRAEDIMHLQECLDHDIQQLKGVWREGDRLTVRIHEKDMTHDIRLECTGPDW